MASTRTSRFLASTAVALAGVSALGATAASATAAFTYREGNPSCADVAPAGATWTEHKLDFDPAAGPYAPNGFEVTISKAADGSLGWTSALDVDAVIMKGGNNANVYAYLGDTDLGDAGLRTPENLNGKDKGGTKYYGISHVTFCSGPPATPSDPGTPSTPGVIETPAPAATPTPESAVSATAAAAPAAPPAVVPQVLETKVLGVSIEAPAAPTPSAPAATQLAATGISSGTLAALAIALILFGGLALALGGRPATED